MLWPANLEELISRDSSWRVLVEQIEDWPPPSSADKDDGPDALSGAKDLAVKMGAIHEPSEDNKFKSFLKSIRDNARANRFKGRNGDGTPEKTAGVGGYDRWL